MREWFGALSGELRRCIRKGSSPKGGQALQQALQGSAHSPMLLEFKKQLDNTRKTEGFNFGWSYVEPGVGLGNSCESPSN